MSWKDHREEKGGLQYGGWDRSTWRYSRKETVWYVLMFMTPWFALKVLASSGRAVADYQATGTFAYPPGYVLVASVTLLLCAIIPFLLKDSEHAFKVSAIVLTSVAPAFLTGTGWYRMLQLVS